MARPDVNPARAGLGRVQRGSDGVIMSGAPLVEEESGVRFTIPITTIS